MNIAVNLLPTSEPLKTQWITFVFEGKAPSIYLNVLMFGQIIRDSASPAEVSIRFFYESLQITFLNNVLVSIRFTMNAAKVYRLSESGSEERGGVSKAHLHLRNMQQNGLL